MLAERMAFWSNKVDVLSHYGNDYVDVQAASSLVVILYAVDSTVQLMKMLHSRCCCTVLE